jgi:hypothetical protein
MASFFRATVREFLDQSTSEILANFATGYARAGYTSQYTDQTLAWERDLEFLKMALSHCVQQRPTAESWHVLLEFSIPRKAARIDCVLLVGGTIVVLEAKTTDASNAPSRQVEDYALLLHYFHKGSDKRRIVPVIVSENGPSLNQLGLNQTKMFPQLATYWIDEVARISWMNLPSLLLNVAKHSHENIDAALWDSSPYFPVPSILEAAVALKSGLSIREIAHSEASELEISQVTAEIQALLLATRQQKQHAICFLTGVPGAGKTLIGLSLAHSSESQHNPVHFMSGNGPLVMVLQQLFKTESMRNGKRAGQAEVEAKTLIENVHVFASNYSDPDKDAAAPSNHAIIFDEAQRAWNRNQNFKKFKRDYSEPEMLLRIMERHEDWALVVALVGGGQEINDGEAGLEEWGRALSCSRKEWVIYASPEVLQGGPSTAGRRLFDQLTGPKPVSLNSSLHLRTSNRSLRAEQLASWVNFVLRGEAKEASALRITERFPIFLTRDIQTTRNILKQQSRGLERYGLVGSSCAARLRPEGLEPSAGFHANYPWQHWYLAPEGDVRSSCQCEVFAREFEIQGLELDWIGLCWGGDMLRGKRKEWDLRIFRNGVNTKWGPIKSQEQRNYRENAYRVLLTRARKGMVLFIPKGDKSDPTNQPEGFDRTFEFLVRCGAMPWNETLPMYKSPPKLV